jgi:hypothetical protein
MLAINGGEPSVFADDYRDAIIVIRREIAEFMETRQASTEKVPQVRPPCLAARGQTAEPAEPLLTEPPEPAGPRPSATP